MSLNCWLPLYVTPAPVLQKRGDTPPWQVYGIAPENIKTNKLCKVNV